MLMTRFKSVYSSHQIFKLSELAKRKNQLTANEDSWDVQTCCFQSFTNTKNNQWLIKNRNKTKFINFRFRNRMSKGHVTE